MTEQTKVVLTRVALAPHEDGYFWRGEIEVDGKLNRKWEILKDEESLSLSYVIQYLEKEFGDNIDITVKSYMDSDIGYKLIPVYVYLKHCDKDCNKLKKELYKYIAKDKDKRKKIKKKDIIEQCDFTFLMLDKE